MSQPRLGTWTKKMKKQTIWAKTRDKFYIGEQNIKSTTYKVKKRKWLAPFILHDAFHHCLLHFTKGIYVYSGNKIFFADFNFNLSLTLLYIIDTWIV